jgi:3-dehydroquinate synthase
MEKATHIPHGEAISTGMVVASALSAKRGLLATKDVERIEALLKKLNLPTKLQIDREMVLDALRKDKKREGERINFVLLKDIGHPVVEEISIKELEAVIKNLYRP